MADREIRILWLSDASQLLRANREVDASLTGLDRQMAQLNQRFGAQIKIATALGTALVTGIAVKGVRAASALNEAQNKSNQVFGQSSQLVTEFAKTSADAFGISQRAANSYAGTLGTILTVSGLTQQQSAEMSINLLKLAADLASFADIPIEEALEKLRSGLVGEAEPLRTVGVLLSAARVEAKAYEAGIANVGDTLTEAQKVQARYLVIMEDTAAAQGDFTRTADDAANASRRLQARTEDQAATLGDKLLPAWEKLQQILLKVPTPVLAIGVAFVTLGTAVGVLLVALPSLAAGLTIVTGATVGLAAAAGTLAVVLGPIGLAGALLVGAGAWLKYKNAQAAAAQQGEINATVAKILTDRTYAEIEANKIAFDAHISELKREQRALEDRIRVLGVNSEESYKLKQRLAELVHETNQAEAGANIWTLALEQASAAQDAAAGTAAGLEGTLHELTGAYQRVSGAAIAASIASHMFDVAMGDAQAEGVSRINDLGDEWMRLQGYLNVLRNQQGPIQDLIDQILGGNIGGSRTAGGMGGMGGSSGGGGGTASTGRIGTLSSVGVVFKNSQANRFAAGQFLGADVGTPGITLTADRARTGELSNVQITVNVAGTVLSDRELKEAIIEAINDAKRRGLDI